MIRAVPLNRRGYFLIAILIALSIVTPLVLVALQQANRIRRESRSVLEQRQVHLLLEAGMRRAVRKIANDSDYRGERWEPRMGEEQRLMAAVEIRPDREEGISNEKPKGGWTIVATVRVASEKERSLQRSFRFPEANRYEK